MREAVIQLAEERLVVIQPQRGIFVVKISVEDVLDAGFVREAIKIAFVATLAALAAVRTHMQKIGNSRICLNRAEQIDGLDSASPERHPEPLIDRASPRGCSETLVNRAFGGRLPGDPLSTRVFERVGWKCPIRAGFRAPALPALFVGGACDQVGEAAG